MDSLYIDTNLTYDPNTLLVNQLLKITNKFNSDLVFKIKTNYKNVVSMTINHGFIKPSETIPIRVKIVQKVEEGGIIKLQVNWAKATEQLKAKNDSKMVTIPKENIYKNSFTILRKVQSQVKPFETAALTQSFNLEQQDQQYKQNNQKVQPKQENIEELVQIAKQIQSVTRNEQKQLFESTMGHTKNLQIVTEQDQEDHEKEIEHIKNKHLQQRRRLDEIKVKLSRLNEEVKGKQLLSFRYLLLLVAIAFIIGNSIQSLFL